MILVAVLCFNEERTIGSVVLGAKKFADKVVVINDGSWDNSLEVALLAGAEVISHEHNEGYGRATVTALREGNRANCDVLVTMDGDGQHNPGDIPLLTAPVLEAKYDVVIGSRFLSEKSQAPIYRQLGQRALVLVSTIAYGCYISDNQCGFRALGRRALRALHLRESSMGASVEIHQQIARLHLRHLDVPVRIRYD